MKTLDRPGTSRGERWLVPGLLLLAAGVAEWLRVPVAGWLVMIWAGVVVLLGLLVRPRSGAAVLLVTVAVLTAGSTTVRQIRVSRIQGAWPRELEQRTLAAALRLQSDLVRTLGVVNDLARAALPLGTAEPDENTFSLLGTLIPTRAEEVGIALFDSSGVLRAWAGRHRLSPGRGPDSLRVIGTDFYTVLQREVSDRRGAVVVSLLLATDAGVPEDPPSMASRFRARTGVGLEISLPAQVADSLDPFDFRIPTSSGDRALYSVRFLPPTQGEALEAALYGGPRLEAWLLIGLLLIAVLVGPHPGHRFIVLAGLLWVGLRAPLGEALGMGTLFSPRAFFVEGLPRWFLPVVHSAGALLLTGTLVSLTALVLWQQAPRRRLPGILLAILLLGSTPWMVHALSLGITPPAGGVTLALWLSWHLALFLSALALLLPAAALLQGPGRGWGLGSAVAGGGSAVGVAVIGAVVFRGPAGWPDWYPFLWAVPMVLVMRLPPRRSALVGVAVLAGSAAALLTWSAEIRGRAALAAQDVAELGPAADPLAEPTLIGFADRLQSGTPPRSAADLYQEWTQSTLARQGYPTRLTLWEGGAPSADLALADLTLPDTVLAALAADSLSDSGSVRIARFPGVPGTHHVLLVRLPQGRAITAVIGPRTTLIPPTGLGRVLYPNTEPTNLYQLLLTPVAHRPTAGGEHGAWWRIGWQLHRDQEVDLAEGASVAHAVVGMGRPGMLAVRGILLLALDVAVLALLWGLATLIGARGPPRVRWAMPGFGHSFRFRLGLALVGFFLIPAAGFALWSLVRLPDETRSSHDLVVAEHLKDASNALAREFRSAEPLDVRLRQRSSRDDAELALYREGSLAAVSTNLLRDLALFDPLVPADAWQSLALRGETSIILASGTAHGHPHRTGYRVHRPPGQAGITILATHHVASDPALAARQADVAMIVLLATLLGIAAAIGAARRAVRGLARPVAELRKAAEQVGQGIDPAPATGAPPLEFVPVFEAFDRMARDVKASREALESARQRIAAVLARVATGVIGVDAQGRILGTNARVEECVGVALPEGGTLREHLPTSWNALSDLLAQALRDDAPIDPPGEEIEVEGRQYSARFTRFEGPGAGGVITLHDITDATRAARILAWGEMASQVAHEIKNPLTPMRLGIQHLQRIQRDRGDVGEVLEETAARILREIDHLDTIARAFSRSAAPGAPVVPPEPVDVAAVAGEVLQLYRVAPEIMAVQILDETGGATRMMARADELREVLLNLLENARAAQATRVDILLMPSSVVVRDNGAGIAVDLLPRIFEPRFSTTTSGSGLGLAIVRRLTESWGATLEVESEVGKGTAMTIRWRPASVAE